MISWKLFVVVFALTTFVFAEKDFNTVVSSLASYQTENGGFRLKNTQAPSLEATYHASLLSSIYGLKNKINASEAFKFVQKHENSDGGYAREAGLQSDLESTRYALLSLHHLGQTLANPSTVSTFLQSLYDKTSHFFALKAGDKSSLKATAFALQVYDLLPEDKFLKSVLPSILDEVKKNVKDDAFTFSKETGSPSTINYYGLVVALKAGYTFQNAAAWAAKIRSRQLEDGGFGSAEATAHAIASLHALQSKGDGKNLFEGLNTQKLLDFARHSSTDLRSASFGHLAVFLSSGIKHFSHHTQYTSSPANGVVEDRIIEGFSVTPSLAIIAVSPVSGLKVSLSTAFGKEAAQTETLVYQNEVYVGAAISTTNKLGAVSFTYIVSWDLPELGTVQFTIKDNKSVGYGITIASKASLASKEIDEGGIVSVGTKFDFPVSLSTNSQKSFLSGDFSVVFSVLDSSNLVVSQKVVDGKKNKDPLAFSYVLKDASISAGQLTFLFEVKNENGVHTNKRVVYTFNVPTIASEIKLNQQKFKLGEKVEISFTPANFPDLRTVVALSNTDHAGKETANRQFSLALLTLAGTRLHTIPGVPKTQAGKTTYSFTFTIPSTFDFIGTNVLSFRYQPVFGNEIELLNYDSNLKELYEDLTPLNFTVNADLYLHNLTPKIKETFNYGDELSLKFQVKDAQSNNVVLAGKHEAANAFLYLRNTLKTRTFTTSNQTATHYTNSKGEPEGFEIKWHVNPNAVSGAGQLILSASDPDGNALPIYKDQSKKEAASYKVTITGTIKTQYKTFVNTPEDDTVFAVAFSLLCQNNILKNAQLRSTVYFQTEDAKNKLFDVPVAVNEQTGDYSVSWLLPKAKAVSGQYVIELFREADRSKSSESGQEPVTTITVPYQAPSQPLPFRTEFFIVLLFVVAFFSVSAQKQKYSS